ncbi:PREDICTED: aspartic proteinase nepenthesin-1 isoform X1 [Tarenaya hassleriana]|uniref:aspartic proteinase nepenthesin-1 isoform X2 n=1 Tax=Tarenaya hassleriana TaxID=28532 RepID=UPI00053C2108|nr:PREDICTED: aspartic proteinase nepenthesin-1 isoform X2 [Tarenaya hassleriana]XP_010548001.1 PREDICTED: aspartic proteinase nepenthesin-1 isoform X1 [Tarenaya hassleriana]
MASLSSSSSSSIFLALTLMLISCSSATSRLPSSRRSALIDLLPQRSGVGFRLTLHHVDSGKNLTKIQKIQRGMGRGFRRLHRLRAAVLAAEDDGANVEAPTHAGNGEFLMKLSAGTPPVTYSAIVDTGSDLIWTQCKPCTKCFDQPTPIFDPEKSSSFSKLGCSSDPCKALPQSNCNKDTCEYLYTYGDYSSTQGILAMETFTFEDEHSVSGLAFGCGEDNEGDGFAQGSGLVGLGRGPLSLVSQLKQNEFSYCLTSIEDSDSTSLLFIGSDASNTLNKSMGGEIQTTSLLRNPAQPSFYYLPLQGITVGSKRLDIEESTFTLSDDGTGGMIIDSGTTLTYLEDSAFRAVKKEFASRVRLPTDDSGATGLDLCFKLPENTKQIPVPKLIFHFRGADLELPGENYMIADPSTGVLCLAMGGSNGMSIFGNIQQQNLLVLHDLHKETVSFIPTECNKL